MNASELAKAMLDWQKVQQEADTLADKIKVAVLALGKTQTVGNVRASYSGGRRSFDYETAVEKCEDVERKQAMMTTFTEVKTVTTTDWKAVCAGMKLEVPFTKSDPSVSLKILKDK